jgi:hypothetical protein
MVKHPSETPEDFASAMKDRKTIEAAEIIRSGASGSEREAREDLCFTDHIVAIREA